MKVLDHGYVNLVESYGSDERIIEAARMSTQKGFEGWGPFCSKCGISMNHVFGGDIVFHLFEATPIDIERGPP